MSYIIKISLVVVVLLVVLYFAYQKLIKQSKISPGGLNTVQEKPLDPNLCAWLNNTYPKLKTGEFSDIDGGRDNPEAQSEWERNKCSLIY